MKSQTFDVRDIRKILRRFIGGIQNDFPVQKTGAPVNEPRRDCGANNKRLPVREAALCAFAVPIAGQFPEAHETSKPTRDGDGVLRELPCGQFKQGTK